MGHVEKWTLMTINKWDSNRKLFEYGKQDDKRTKVLDQLFMEHYEHLQDYEKLPEYVQSLSREMVKPGAKEVHLRRHGLWKRVLTETKLCIKAGIGNESVSLVHNRLISILI